jgi:hypothetical protein|nr:MAG TPA: hypothetical protein [Caudoviricetes sp.]
MAKAETKTILKAYSTVESKLSTLPPEDGQLIFVYDKKKIILDNHGVRTVYEQIQTIETEEQRNDLLAPIDSFYFVIETSILWRYTNGHWNQITTSPQEQIDRIVAEGAKQIKEVQDKGAEVLQSIPEDFATQMETKLNKQQGIENKGKVLVIGEDGNVMPEEVASGGGDGIAIINTMSGESPLVIPDSAERVNKRLELGGKTEQVQTTGAQLLKPKDGSYTVFGVSVDIANGEIKLSGTATSSGGRTIRLSEPFLLKAGTYSSEVDGKIDFILSKNSDNSYLVNLAVKNFNVNEDTEVYVGLNVMAQNTYNNKYHIMLNSGNIALPYEPYTGGKPSPSPEYPQEIKSVGKWNDEKQKYEVEISISGRNLFDFSTCEEGKIFEGSGNIVSTTNGVLTDFIPCFPNSQYSRSRTGSTVVAFYDCNKNKIGFEIVGNTTFVTPEKCRYFRFSAVKTQVDYTKIVACPGNTVMDYEPYKKPQSLTLTSDRPITKWDRLVEQGGQIGWLYQSSKMILDGTKIKWLHSNKPENSYFATTIIDAYGGKGASFCKTYRNIQDSAYVIKYANERCIYSDHPTYTSGDKFFRAPNENVTTLEQWKEFIDENPIEMLYHTKNSEFVPLPQSEQNAIRALTTHYPTTVITVDGGELDPDIKVTYTADTKNYIDGKVSAKVASILRQYQADTANLLSLMPMETQATMIENDTNNILNNLESEEAHE